MLIEFSFELTARGFCLKITNHVKNNIFTLYLTLTHSHTFCTHAHIFWSVYSNLRWCGCDGRVQTDTLLYNAQHFANGYFSISFWILDTDASDALVYVTRCRCQCLLYLICLKLQKPAENAESESELEDFVAICLTDYRFEVVGGF